MIAAVRPPEYFPRLPYAALLLVAERFVIGDTFPYSRQSAHNRCRIRTPDGSRWLTVPVVRCVAGTPVERVRIAPDRRWRATHRKTITHHYSSAPFYSHYCDEVTALVEAPAETLAELALASVRWAAAALGAAAEVVAASSLGHQPSSTEAVLRIVAPAELLTLPESAASDVRAAARAGALARVVHFLEAPRRQNFPGFVPGCSVLDLLMNHGPDAAAYLRACLEPRTGP